MKTFSGKVAAITGAGSGIGQATAIALAREGCHLALSDISEQSLEGTVERLAGYPVRISTHLVDVSDRDAVYRYADDTVSEHGKVNIIMNNAGVGLGETVENMSYDNFEWLMNINFWGVVYGTKSFLPMLRQVDEAHVINISSLFGLGALPSQLEAALDDVEAPDRAGLLKLYNASNWFDERAVPAGDDVRIAELCAGFRWVIVESHARLLLGDRGERCRRFGDALDGRLQVALGVETVHPEALPRLNKGLDLEDLRRAAANLRSWHQEIRTFVLIGAPYVPEAESVDWTVRSCEFSLESGAVAVSLIPLRPVVDQQTAPSLEQVEEAWTRCRGLSPAVQLDVWDLDRLVVPGNGSAERVARLRHEQLDLAKEALA